MQQWARHNCCCLGHWANPYEVGSRLWCKQWRKLASNYSKLLLCWWCESTGKSSTHPGATIPTHSLVTLICPPNRSYGQGTLKQALVLRDFGTGFWCRKIGKHLQLQIAQYPVWYNWALLWEGYCCNYFRDRKDTGVLCIPVMYLTCM